MLLVPLVSWNPLSILKLCANNNVAIEFDKLIVKAQEIRFETVVDEGRESGGLYQLPLLLNKEFIVVLATTMFLAISGMLVWGIYIIY